MFCIPEGPGIWKNNHYFLLAEGEGEILFSTKKNLKNQTRHNVYFRDNLDHFLAQIQDCPNFPTRWLQFSDWS